MHTYISIKLLKFKEKIAGHTASVRNFKALAIFCVCTVRFVSDLVGKPPTDRVSYDVAKKHVHFAIILFHDTIAGAGFCDRGN